MNENEQDQVIVDEVAENNEEVKENTEETVEEVTEDKPAKPKRTPQEEYEYHTGRAKRLAKQHGFGEEHNEPVKKTPSAKPNELDYGQKAFLNSYGIKGSDELALVRQFQDRGFDLDGIVNDDIFNSKLTSLRDARASANAIPKAKGRSTQTNVTDIDVAVAKFHETGELPKDFETRNKVVDAITKKEKGVLFSN